MEKIPGLTNVARTEGTSLEVKPGDLGQPGIQGELHILAEVRGDKRSSAEKFGDTTERKFKAFARLSKSPPVLGAINGGFSAKDGNSYLEMVRGEAYHVATSLGEFLVHKNDAGELSVIEVECGARTLAEAQFKFIKTMSPFLDHLSYFANVPIYVVTLRIEDPSNYRTTITFTAPYGTMRVSEGFKNSWTELFPVYSMYREAKNATSDFYRFLCFHKLLDGLLGPMRASVMKRAEEAGLKMERVKDVVPDSKDYSDTIRPHVGQPMKGFLDNVLTKQFRNAMAHFGTTDGVILDMSNPEHQSQYANLILVMELCVRKLIETHENYLHQLSVKQAARG